MARALVHSLKSSPELLKELIGPTVQPLVQPLQQALQGQQMASWERETAAAWKEFETQYPDFGAGKPLHDALARTFQDNPWLQDVAQRDPRKAYELGRKLTTADVTDQQLRAAQAKAKQTGQTAATSRPGAGGGAMPAADGTPEQIIRTRAAEHTKRTGQVLSEADIQDQIQRLARFMGGKGKAG